MRDNRNNQNYEDRIQEMDKAKITLKTLLRGGDGLSEKQEEIRSIFMYLVSGGLTTLANLVCFYLFDYFVKAELNVVIFGKEFDMLLLINQVIAWFVAVIVAYVTNRAFVFVSNNSIIKEFLSFAAARIATLVTIELGLFSVMVMLCESVLKTPEDAVIFSIGGFTVTALFVVKIVNSVILVVANYVLSKIFVFKKTDKETNK